MKVSPVVLALIAGLTGGSANAMLLFDGMVDMQGTGIGAVNTVLTIQDSDGDRTEIGSVGRAPYISDDVITGEAKTGSSQTSTRSLSDLSLTSASELRIVFNANEPGTQQGRNITLSDLQLNIYSPTGALLFNSGAFATQSFTDPTGGTGNSGAVFKLDATQAAAAQAAAFGPGSSGNLIGLSATATDASGGVETFFVTSVPEPSSYLLMLAGMVAIGLIARRKV
jgi:PEP-CTERM motif